MAHIPVGLVFPAATVVADMSFHVEYIAFMRIFAAGFRKAYESFEEIIKGI